jgi:hypothetical protein
MGSSVSPSFVRNEIPDDLDDWYSLRSPPLDPVRIKENDIKNITGSVLGNIGSASYVSDGKKLDATLWLARGYENKSDFKNSFEESPLGHDPIYGVYLDVDSNIKTGREGIDYAFVVARNNSTKHWEMFSFETSWNGNSRILDLPINFTGFNEERGYITIPVDLSGINYPNQYVMAFFILDTFSNGTQVLDTTNWLNIPPPVYSISILPNQISLRPGDERLAELRINQIGLPTHTQPNVSFSTNPPKAFDIRFSPDQTSLPVNEAATTTLYISSPLNESIRRSYVVPIYANITYPGEYLKSGGDSILQISNFTVTVLPYISPSEILQQINNDWISPISNMWTFFLGVGSTIVVIVTWYYKKRLQSNKQKTLDGRWV